MKEIFTIYQSSRKYVGLLIGQAFGVDDSCIPYETVRKANQKANARNGIRKCWLIFYEQNMELANFTKGLFYV